MKNLVKGITRLAMTKGSSPVKNMHIKFWLNSELDVGGLLLCLVGRME